jgi:hypothetical protein
MKLKTLGLAGIGAMVLTAILSPSASATTLEVGGVAQNKSITITMSQASGTSSLTRLTSGEFISTCTGAHLHGETVSPFTGGSKATGFTTALVFTGCGEQPQTVDMAGQFFIEHIVGTTNGTVFMENSQVTVQKNPLITISCGTLGGPALIGTLTGVSSGHAVLDINAVLKCGVIYSSVVWEAKYVVTSPTNLGVVR